MGLRDCGIEGLRGSAAKITKLNGYTLVELTIVVFLIGTMLTLTVPRIQFLSDDPKGDTRQFVGKIRDIKGRAVRDKKAYQLHLDLSSDEMWVSAEADPDQDTGEEPFDDQFGDGNAEKGKNNTPILDVHFPHSGKENSGEVVIHFSKEGYVEPAMVHLGTRVEDAYSVHLSPFLGVLDIYDGYIELETVMANDR